MRRELPAVGVTPTRGTILKRVRKVEALGHKLYMDSYFSSPTLFDDLYTRKINCCGTVLHNRKQVTQFQVKGTEDEER
jgi:hypothetical protein